jgi:hypothetical protein
MNPTNPMTPSNTLNKVLPLCPADVLQLRNREEVLSFLTATQQHRITSTLLITATPQNRSTAALNKTK